jgi:hypothetical protein
MVYLMVKIEFHCDKCDRLREAKSVTFNSGINGLTLDVVCVACGIPQTLG